MDQVLTTETTPRVGAQGPIDVGIGIPVAPLRKDVFRSEHQDNGDYTVYDQHIEYPTETGIILLPVSVKGGLCVPVRLHSGRSMMIIRGTAERRNAHPLIPHPDINDPNAILINALFYPSSPAQLFNTIVYRVSWYYTYHLKKPKMPGDPHSRFPLGSSPAELQPSSQRLFEFKDFDKTINDTSMIRDGSGQIQLDIPIRVEG